MRRVFPDQVVVSTVLKETKKVSEVPDANDAVATMKYWDEYRRKEREKTAQMSPEEHLQYFKGVIGEFPTPERLRRLELEEAARNAPKDQSLWQRLRRLVGTWMQSVLSGARSVRRTLGTWMTGRP